MSWRIKIYLLLENEFISGYHIHNDGFIHPIIWKENNTVFCHNCGEEHEIDDEEIEKEEIDNFWISDYKYGKYIHLGITAPKYHVHTNGEKHRCTIFPDRIRCNECDKILDLKTNHSEIIYYQRKKISALSEMQILVANGRVFWFKTIKDDEEKYFCFNGFLPEISEGFKTPDGKIISTNDEEIIYKEDSLIFELEKPLDEEDKEKLFSNEIKKKPTNKNPTLNFTPPIGNEVAKKEKTLVPDGGLAPMEEEDDRLETSPYLHPVDEDEDEEKRPTVVVDAIPVNTGEFDSIVDIPQEEDNNDSIFEVPDEDDDENEEDQSFDESTPLPSENSPVINSEEETIIDKLEKEIEELRQEVEDADSVDDLEFANGFIKSISPKLKELFEEEHNTREKNEESRLIQFSEKLEELLSAEEDRITAREALLEERAEEHNKKVIAQGQNVILQTADQVQGEQIQSQKDFGDNVTVEKENVSKIVSDGKDEIQKIAVDSEKSNKRIWIWGLIFVLIFGITLSILSFALSFKLYQKAKRENTVLTEKLIKQEKSFKKLVNAGKKLKAALKDTQSKNSAMLIKFENSFNDQQAKWQLSVEDAKKEWITKQKDQNADEYFWSYYLWSYWIYLDKDKCCDDLKRKFKTLENTAKSPRAKKAKRKVIPKKKLPKLAPKAKKRKPQKRNYFETTSTDKNGKISVEKIYY